MCSENPNWQKIYNALERANIMYGLKASEFTLVGMTGWLCEDLNILPEGDGLLDKSRSDWYEDEFFEMNSRPYANKEVKNKTSGSQPVEK